MENSPSYQSTQIKVEMVSISQECLHTCDTVTSKDSLLDEVRLEDKLVFSPQNEIITGLLRKKKEKTCRHFSFKAFFFFFGGLMHQLF